VIRGTKVVASDEGMWGSLQGGKGGSILDATRNRVQKEWENFWEEPLLKIVLARASFGENEGWVSINGVDKLLLTIKKLPLA
jgi:hypothetical protein